MPAPHPRLHGLVHEHGGPDPIRVTWEDVGTSGGGGGGGTPLIIQDEGVALPTQLALNFVGPGVTAVDDAANSRTQIGIPGYTGGAGPGDDELWLALGFKVINGDPRGGPVGGARAWVTSTVYGTAVYLTAGRTINSLGFYESNAGFTVTLARLGIYDASRVLVASTPNTVTLPQNTGWRKATLSAAFTPTAPGLYYLAALLVGSNLGNFGSIRAAQMGQSDVGTSPAAGAPSITWQQSGQTDLPNPATFTPSIDYMPLLYGL